jgi:ribosome-binding protein aMBF1 (putative translation factor)
VNDHHAWPVGGRRPEEVEAGRDDARRAYELAVAIRTRRLELGLSQSQLARRAGMSQPVISRLEEGGSVPTLRVLDRLAAALDADLVVALTPHAG